MHPCWIKYSFIFFKLADQDLLTIEYLTPLTHTKTEKFTEGDPHPWDALTLTDEIAAHISDVTEVEELERNGKRRS